MRGTGIREPITTYQKDARAAGILPKSDAAVRRRRPTRRNTQIRSDPGIPMALPLRKSGRDMSPDRLKRIRAGTSERQVEEESDRRLVPSGMTEWNRTK